ncbi:MAG: hypothetical protein GY910_01905 [bacterium]|nr:hypothetical protein [bacterium]
MLTLKSSIVCSILVLLCLVDVSGTKGQAVAAEDFVPAEMDPVLAQAKRAVRLRDFEKAVALWEKAARRGHPRAQFRLGVAYRSGRGIEQDNTKAAHWFGKAAEAGDADARYALGKLYEGGRGVERNRDRAIELMGRAARSGHREAKQSLDRIQRSTSVAYSTADGRIAANRMNPRAALTQAIRIGDLGSARESLARGAPINGAPGDSKHWKPLILAIQQKNAEMVEFLLERGADPNRISRIGEPALILAIRSQESRIAHGLIAAGGNPAKRSLSGYTPLMEAARLGLGTVTRDLLVAGANPKTTLDDDTSAADIARRFGFNKIASRLRRAGAPILENAVSKNRLTLLESSQRGPGSEGITFLPPILEAARRGDAELIRELVANRASLTVTDSDGNGPLHRSAENGHSEATRALLNAGVPPDLPGRGAATPLLLAMASTSEGSEDVIAALIEAGADPGKRDHSSAGIIAYAASGATEKKLALVAAAEASWTDAEISQSLERAALSGQLDATRALLLVTPVSADRIAALCSAISAGQMKILDLLLSEELPIDRPCGVGRTALLMAVQTNQAEIVEKLLHVGANPNSAIETEDTALIAAASRGFTALVSTLIDSGADVSHRGAHRLTPLMGAASNGHIGIVETLLEAGADRGMRDEAGRTASDLADAAGYADIAEMIASHRAEWRIWFGSREPSP